MTADPVKLHEKAIRHAKNAMRIESQMREILLRIKGLEEGHQTHKRQINALDSSIKSHESTANTAVALGRQFKDETSVIHRVAETMELTRQQMSKFCEEAAQSSRWCLSRAERAVNAQEAMEKSMGTPLFIKLLLGVFTGNAALFWVFANHTHLANGVPKPTPGNPSTFLVLNIWEVVIACGVVILALGAMYLVYSLIASGKLKKRNAEMLAHDKELHEQDGKGCTPA